MVNDLNTLSGALVECKDQLISELANQGVTATYDPTTGLLGLIAHIADIQGGETVLYEDDATTDKTNNYTFDTGVMTYNSTNHCYNLKAIANSAFNEILINNITINTNVKISFDILFNSTTITNLQPAIQINNMIARVIFSGNTRQIDICNQSYSSITSTNVSINTDTWYHYDLYLTYGMAVFTLKQGDTQLRTINANVSSLLTTDNTIKLLIGYVQNSNVDIKNIKITEI